jgi:Uma2 family endonuclease
MAATSVHGAIRRRRFTMEEYARMIEAGVLTEEDRVELIAGEIVEMSPIGPGHADDVNALDELLHQQVGRAVRISVQKPIRLANDGAPQPDVALLKRRRYRDALPGAEDVLAVFEVADSSRDYDRGVKLPLYAAAGIPEAWLIDLVAETIERHSEPRDGRYRLIALAGRGETLGSTVLPALTIPVDAILG